MFNSLIMQNPFEKIKHDIRNFRELSSEQMQYIATLSDSQKLELLIIYNEIIITWNENMEKI